MYPIIKKITFKDTWYDLYKKHSKKKIITLKTHAHTGQSYKTQYYIILYHCLLNSLKNQIGNLQGYI